MNPSFELLREEFVPDIKSKVQLFRHKKSGAQVLSIQNDDENKSFSVNFFTPVTDSTGLPHIMEHSVLCGSRKYPVKEPFIEMNKGSLATFLNAFTFPDRTCYPVASQNAQDFYNLIDVYLDAVFYPRITPETLKQEGWHYELDDPSQPLNFKGVVFNEMKGNYSSPESLVEQHSMNGLFPDTLYGFDSGGDPREIPNLTYERFKHYHDTYYHPANAMIYFYGDDDPEKRLEIIDGYLRDFDAIKVDRTVAKQPRWDAPKRKTYHFEGGEESKAQFTLNWIITDSTQIEEMTALEVLSHILIGTSASPLQQTLIESGLGEGLSAANLERNIYELYFSVGLKGIAPEDVEKGESLILDTLRGLVEKGIDPDMIEASLNTIEFRVRELNTGGFPRGLAMLLNVLTTWTYNADPIAPLFMEGPLTALKTRLASGEKVFEEMIRKYFLDNPHRLTMTLTPKAGFQDALEAQERARLETVRASMSDADLKRIAEETEQLKAAQEAPDSPESLAKLPALHLNDLDRVNKTIPREIENADGVPVIYHDLFTNGIAYVDIGFNLFALPAEYLPLVPLFSDALLELGTIKEDYIKLTQRIGQKTGGINVSTLTSPMRTDRSKAVAYLMVRGKSTVGRLDDLLAIFEDILLTVKLDNQERFKQIALEAKASMEGALLPAGHRVVNDRLRAAYNLIDWAEEQMGGLSALFALRELIKQIDSDWGGVLAKLEDMRRLLVNRKAMIVNVTLDGPNWEKSRSQISRFVGTLPAFEPTLKVWQPVLKPVNEAFSLPSQVNYVAKGANLYDLGYELHGSFLGTMNFLNSGYLWERVRVQGGAYGGFSMFDRLSGVWTFLSYRDPNLTGTLRNYDGAAAYLKSVELPERELTRVIIGGIGIMDAYQLPDAKGFTSLTRYLIGESDEMRQKTREQLLGMTVKDIQALGTVLEKLNSSATVTVLGSPNAIESANVELGGLLSVTKVM
ncbi:MAG: insulinase family protein [Anaerolineae bacterium]|nr:insulinase family protein [Anaerolineae bacterium]